MSEIGRRLKLTIDDGKAWAIRAPFTNTLEVTFKESWSNTRLQAFLDDLTGVLVHAVLDSVVKNHVKSEALIPWGTVLAIEDP